ncbi:Deoxyguanosinetriphosphate triphosphohydrolase-like protein [bioreactor metagenome]|uniref:Deoxyguanosinetriphosphate triphosphohydrolase-like protein n=1 Tax=bioreactor metagenome TaxID=1076179 RepID=A0A644XGW3_9ZZZZ
MARNTIPQSELIKRTDFREPDIRGHFYRDQTAIIHSRPFRRLKNKTQVFFSPDDDHVCTRIEHVLHVATIAATICKGLKSKPGCNWELDEDMAYAIGLAHDLGHTPFGHSGERQLNVLMKDQGGFAHELNSYRVVEKLAERGQGLNLTWAVKNGIICHNGESFERTISPDQQIIDLDKVNNRKHLPATYEGVIVRFSDKIAYLGRDIEDAVIAGMIGMNDIPEEIRTRIGAKNGEIINHLVLDLIDNSTDDQIGFSEECYELLLKLKDFNYQRIYRHPVLMKYEKYCVEIINRIFGYLLDRFNKYGFEHQKYSEDSKLSVDQYFGNYLHAMQPFYEKERATKDASYSVEKQILSDYISGMTDKFAIECMQQLSIPQAIDFRRRLENH